MTQKEKTDDTQKGKMVVSIKEQFKDTDEVVTKKSIAEAEKEITKPNKPRPWAVIKRLKVIVTVKVYQDDLSFMTSDKYKMILLSNMVIKVSLKGKEEEICMIPISNVAFFSLDQEDDIA